MPIPDENRRNDYVGNNTTPTYSYTFKIFSKNDLRVTETTSGVPSVLTVDVDYTVSGVGNEGGGTITLLGGNLATGNGLHIELDPAAVQPVELRNQGPTFRSLVVNGLDRLANICKSLKNRTDRSLKVRSQDMVNVSTDLPAPVASSFLGLLADGTSWGFSQAGSVVLATPASNSVTESKLGDGAVVEFDTIAQMKAYAGNAVYAVVKGYTTAGDGGGGQFYRDAVSAATSDDGLVFTPDTLTGRWLRVYKQTGTVNARWFGAVETSDDRPFIQAAIDSVYANGGGKVFIPAGTYQCNNCLVLKSNIELYGEGEASKILNTRTNADNYFEASPILMGTYGGWGGTLGVDAETSYNIADMDAGDFTATLDTAGDASNFSVGDLVAIVDGDDNSGGFPLSEMLNRVKSVSGAVISFEHPVRDSYTTVGRSPRLHVLNTGSVTALLNYAGNCVENCKVHDLFLSVSDASYNNGWGQGIHLSGYECRIYDCRIRAGIPLAGNPFAFSLAKDLILETSREGAEFAYLNNDSALIDSYVTRSELGDDSSLALGILLNQEGAIDFVLDNVTVDYLGSSSSNFATLDISGKRAQVRNCRVRGSNNLGNGIQVTTDAEYAKVVNCEVLGAGIHGIRVQADNCVIRDNTVRNWGSGGYPVRISGVDCVVDGNVFPTGTIGFSKVKYDDETQSGAIGKNIGKDGYHLKHQTSTFVSHTGTTSQTVMETATIPANRMDGDHGFKVDVLFSVSGSSLAGTKTALVRYGGTTVATVSMGASDVGYVAANIYILHRLTGTQNVFGFITQNGAVTGFGNEISVASGSDNEVDITFQLGDASDSMALRLFRVTSLDK